MTAAPFFLQSELVIFDADVTTICSVNISKTEELYTFPSRPSLPSSTHRHTFRHTYPHTHTHTPTHTWKETTQERKTKTAKPNTMEMTASVICWLSRWHSAETKGNGGQTLCQWDVQRNEMTIKNQWKEFYFKEIKVVDWYNANNFQKSPMPF